MPMLSIYVADELDELVQAELPNLNLSTALAEHLTALLRCEHDRLICRDCSAAVDFAAVIAAELERFFVDLMRKLEELVHRLGTAEGAARVARDLAINYHVPKAKDWVLPRPTRGERAAALAQIVADMPLEADSRRRHPTARPAPKRQPTTTEQPEESA